jgi:hypothetical protein
MSNDPIKRIFTATLVLGVSGAGKTTLLEGFAVYLWETYGKVLLLYSWDGGAIPTRVQKRMKQGLIRFWRARTRSAEGLGIETLYQASKGYWPRLINPETGETSPAVDLVPPVTALYAVSCANGHLIKTVPSMGLVGGSAYCQTCNAPINPASVRVEEQTSRTKGFEEVGGVAFDGLTSMANVVMEHMDHARGQGQIGGEKAAFGGVVQSGVVKLGGNNRADVGFGQSRAQQFVNNSLGIPYLVEGPVFTALSMEATDEGGLSIVGAKLPGRAATDEASSWFGNAMEMGKIVDEAGKSHFALFTRPYTDSQGRRHLLKTSSSEMGIPSALPAVLIDPPEGEGKAGLVANLGKVFQTLDTDLRAALAEETSGPMPAAAPGEYGEPKASTAAAAPVQTVTTGSIPTRGTIVMPSTLIRPAMAPQPQPTTSTPPPPGARPPQRAPGSN